MGDEDRRRREGRSDTGAKREEGEAMFHDLQRLIARLFPGPDWSLPCAGLPLSAGAKALQPLPEPRLQKRSARSRSRVTSVRSIAGRPTWLQRLSTPLGQQAPLTPVLPTSLINLNLGRKGGAGLTRNTNVCVCVCVCVCGSAFFSVSLMEENRSQQEKSNLSSGTVSLSCFHCLFLKL